MHSRNILIVLIIFSTSIAVAGDPKWKELRRKKIARDHARQGKIVPDAWQLEATLAWEKERDERRERKRERAAREWEMRTYNVDEEEEYDPEAWMYDPQILAAASQGVSTL